MGLRLLQPDPQRHIDQLLADEPFKIAAVESIQQGCLDAYNLGHQYRLPLARGNYGHAQIMAHLATRLGDLNYLGLTADETDKSFQWLPVRNQIRLVTTSRYDTPTRILGRSGRHKRGYFEVSPVGPITVEMLRTDHGGHTKQQPLFLVGDEVEPAGESYQDIYLVYDFVIHQTQNPFLNAYLVFPMPPGERECKLPYLEYETIFQGEIGPLNRQPEIDGPILPVIDFDIPEKKVADS